MMNCEHVRDVMPELITGRLDEVEAPRVRAHIDTCSDCRAEYALATVIANRRYAFGTGFEQRVVAASLNRRVTVWTRGRMTLAASIAIAVIGGSVLVAPPFLQPGRDEGTTDAVVTPVEGVGYLGADGALTAGRASLNDLSIEELERLLAELDRDGS